MGHIFFGYLVLDRQGKGNKKGQSGFLCANDQHKNWSGAKTREDAEVHSNFSCQFVDGMGGRGRQRLLMRLEGCG